MDDERNIETDQAEKAEVEGSEKYDISGRAEAVQAAGERDGKENPQRETKNGERPGIQ
jgi:hypothetical protein